MNEHEARKNAREDITRVIHQQSIKEGRLPPIREAEVKANEVGDRNDKREDMK